MFVRNASTMSYRQVLYRRDMQLRGEGKVIDVEPVYEEDQEHHRV